MFKYNFGCHKIDFLRHLIFVKGVKANHSKIACMIKWLIPTSLRSLRGFLSFMGYYQKFIQAYGIINAPLLISYTKTSSIGMTKLANPFRSSFLTQASLEPTIKDSLAPYYYFSNALAVYRILKHKIITY